MKWVQNATVVGRQLLGMTSNARELLFYVDDD